MALAIEAFDVPGSFPACFSSDAQYRVWQVMAYRIRPGASSFCTDCTPEFQAERIAQQRCEFPGTTFHIGVDGFIDGVRPGCRAAPRSKPLPKPSRGKRALKTGAKKQGVAARPKKSPKPTQGLLEKSVR